MGGQSQCRVDAGASLDPLAQSASGETPHVRTIISWMIDQNVLIRGGQLVDGTGTPGRPADVRVRAGLVAEVGVGLVPDGEREIDASGALVTPGFIDNHTHF